MIQAVIFDLDGTLIDTEKNASVTVVNCFRRWNLPLDQADAGYITGKTWQNAFDYLFSKYELPVSADEAARTIQEEYTRSIQQNLELVPGGAEAVAELAKSYPLALVSGSYRADILWALEKMKIRHHFQVILGAEDYPRSKPEPDGYLQAMKTLGTSGENTLIFEDSTAGIASARAAGAWVVAITSTNHFSQDQALAHEKISDLIGMNRDWIANFTRRHQK